MEEARIWVDKSGGLVYKSVPSINELGPADQILSKALKSLHSIQSEQPESQEMITVAVDDMKIISFLMKLVVVFGVYARTDPAQLMPFESQFKDWPRPPHLNEDFNDEIVEILTKNDDVAKLILINPLVVDLLAYLTKWEDQFALIADKLPTSKLYAAIIQLQAVKRPAAIISKVLSGLPINRSNAVVSLIELSKESTNFDLQKCIIVLSTARDVNIKEYIDCLGIQLYDLVCIKTELQASAIEIVVYLDQRSPKVLGKLRNLLIEPLIGTPTTETSSGKSLVGLLALVNDSNARQCRLVDHLATKCLLSLWLLVVKSEAQASFVDLLAKFIEVKPELIISLSFNLLIDRLQGNLQWVTKDQKEPELEVILTKPKEWELSDIDMRVQFAQAVLEKISDDVATHALLLLVKQYLSGTLVDPLRAVFMAKLIEKIISEPSLKAKLFGGINEVLSFSFGVLETKLKPVNQTQPLESKVHQLEIKELQDSDDEDSDGEDLKGDENSEFNEEDANIIDLLVQLITGAAMESLGNANINLESLVKPEYPDLLLKLTKMKISANLLEKTNFCIQLLDGSIAKQYKEVDPQDTDGVLNEAKRSLLEPLPPSQAYGLYLYSKLVEQKKITIEEVIPIFTNALAAEDSYVYLNAIKGIESSAKSHNTTDVARLLIPYLSSTTKNVDQVLRAREALIKILTPGSVQNLNSELIDLHLSDLKSTAKDTVDYRFRLSSASILGLIINQFPKSVSQSQQRDIYDCIVGILTFEDDIDLHKAVVILALEFVNATNDGVFEGSNSLSSLKTQITRLNDSTNDDTLKDHCSAVLEAIP